MFLGRKASKDGLQKLVIALENRFNGDIFPINFENEKLRDSHVNLVASVFMGDEIIDSRAIQRSIDFQDFQAYNFQFIPIELLSSIYELFLHSQDEGKNTGAFYTPEILADFLLSEIHTIKPLSRGMKVLDPSCGSGVFLVLAYKQLIESELASGNHKNLSPDELRNILVESIYGVERETDACNVTELSLLLTLLNYVTPPELDKNPDFRFPTLRNYRIFNCDFFDDNSMFWKSETFFDWIVGNPPWISSEGEKFVQAWIEKNKVEKPVGDGRVVEAFSWRVGEKLKSDGIIGIVHHATSLFNAKSKKYRQSFFQQHEVYKVTNFSNFRDYLFDGRATAPAATIIYCLYKENHEKSQIIHYGPFSVNQIQNFGNSLWAITINESEVQTVTPDDAETGEGFVWKLALWGTHRDKRAIERIRYLFPLTLEEFSKKRGWPIPAQGLEFRDIRQVTKKENLQFKPELEGMALLSLNRLNKEPLALFSIPDGAIRQKMQEYLCYLRRGERTGIPISEAPHIFISANWNHVIYSEVDFVIPARQIGISTGKNKPKEDNDYLKALSLYLRSSLITYYIFFQSPEWGIFRQANRVILREVRNIPVPDFSNQQVANLVSIHQQFVEQERHDRERDTLLTSVNNENYKEILQTKLDENIFEILEIPISIRILCRDFVATRLKLDKGVSSRSTLRTPPDRNTLLAYATILRNELDSFMSGKAYHHVTIHLSPSLVRATITVEQAEKPYDVSVENIPKGLEENFDFILQLSGERLSQWVYLQKGLRIFEIKL